MRFLRDVISEINFSLKPWFSKTVALREPAHMQNRCSQAEEWISAVLIVNLYC
jgi:hypothetical protein